MQTLEDGNITRTPGGGSDPSPFSKTALALLELGPTTQRTIVYAILNEVHLVHGGSNPMVKTACSILRCAIQLNRGGDLRAIDRVLLWCFDWIRERAR